MSRKDERAFSVVVVDDDELLLRSISRSLEKAGLQVTAFTRPEDALAAAADPTVDVLLADVRMEGLSGLDLLRFAKGRRVELEVVMMSGQGAISDAVEAMRRGAYDYLSKPFVEADIVERVVKKAAERRRLLDRNRLLEEQVAVREDDLGVVGRSQSMSELRDLVRRVAASDSTVLVQGESGTGKELVARALHRVSKRTGKPFVAVNCSALTETLLESELFGHVRGAFTGATNARRGLFEEAHGGTIFLDEIGDISPALQVRLLRVLQEGEIRRVGGEETRTVDVRVVAATNVDLAKAVRQNRFRQDLFYRLNVISVRVPPLRERLDDVPHLADHFLAQVALRSGGRPKRMAAGFLEALGSYAFPGNVRELENLVERAVVLCQGDELTADSLPETMRGPVRVAVDDDALARMPFLEARRHVLQQFQRRYFGALLRRSGGSIGAAARAAGMDRSNFRRALKSCGLRGEDSGEGEENGPSAGGPQDGLTA